MRSWMFASLFLAVPVVAVAQNRWSVAPYVGTNLSLPGGPALTGVAVGYSAGPFGVRGALAIQSPWNDLPSGAPGDGAFTSDVDLRLAWRTSSGYVPALFAGVGLEGARDEGDMRVLPTWSAGAGFGYELFRWARLESEARYRAPFASLEPDDAFSRGLELRVGVAISWSAGGRSRTAGTAVIGRDPARWRAPRSAAERDAIAARIIDTADDYLGTPYLWGGNSPTTGFDCSGFLVYVFDAHGLRLPRTSWLQARVGDAVGHDPDDWAVGDLLFFASDGRTVDHAALYAGNGRIIHSSESGNGVRYDDLSSARGRWYREHLVGVRRVM